MKKVPFEEVFLWGLNCLVAVAMISTALQHSFAPWGWLIFFTPFFLKIKKFKSLSLPPISLVFVTLVTGLIAWVMVSGYYPERDNDAVSYLMAKAKALALFGYLPKAYPDDPQYTINHDYPLGFLSLSGAVHSMAPSFSISLHRFTLAVQSCCVFMGMYRFFGKQNVFLTDVLLILLVAVQPSIWANGYHDALWALSLSLGLAWALAPVQELSSEKVSHDLRAIPWLIFASLGKSEAQVITLLTIPVAAFILKKPKLLLACIPAITWFIVAKFLHLPSTRLSVWQPYPFAEVALPLVEHTKQLLLFKTHYGATSLGLWLMPVILFWHTRKTIWVPLSGLTVFIAAYFFSNFLPEWNIRFSWPRVLLYPIFSAMILGVASRIRAKR